MASKAKVIGSMEPKQLDTAVEEREISLSSSHEHEIRNRAYEIYVQRGRHPGFELEDWLQAEREIAMNFSRDCS